MLTSATLTVAGSFDFLRQSLGFTDETSERVDWLKLSSPFDYQKQALMLVATGRTPASRPALVSAAAASTMPNPTWLS